MGFFESFIHEAPEGATRYQVENDFWMEGYPILDDHGICRECYVNDMWLTGGGYNEGHTFTLDNFDIKNMKVVETLNS